MKRKTLYFCVLVVLMSLLIIPSQTKKTEAASDVTEDMILHLKFDGDLTDSSSSALNGEDANGGITYENGILGKCAVFNGENYIEIKDTDVLDLKDNFTISLWAYKEDMKDIHVPYIYKEEDEESWASPYNIYENWKNSPGIYLHDGEYGDLNQFYTNGSVIDIRQWFLLTVTYDGDEVKLYNNKQLMKKTSVTGIPAATTGNLFIGMLNDLGETLFFKGKMDDLRIYRRALAANEVGKLYDNGFASAPSLLQQKDNLVAFYKFENNFKDSSGNGNDAERVTSVGSVKYVDALNGLGAKFTKGSYLEVEGNDSINFDRGFTLTTWVSTAKSSSALPIISRVGVSTGSSSNDYAYGFHVFDDRSSFVYSPLTDNYELAESYYVYEDNLINKWYHIAVTFDGGNIRWYKNGALVNKEEIDGIKISHASGNLMIGSDGESFFEGTLDELKLYNYAITSDEVKKDFGRIDKLSISKTNQDKMKSLKAKDTVKLQVSRTFIDLGGTKVISSGLIFKSSNVKVLTVSKDGVITALKKGSANITVTHGGISKTYKVIVK